MPLAVNPACLRGAGGTHLCWRRAPVPDIAWRGRWRQLRNLEYYLQEEGGLEFLNSLPVDARDRILVLSRYSVTLVELVLVRGMRLEDL